MKSLNQIAPTLGVTPPALYLLRSRRQSEGKPFPTPLIDTGSTQLYDEHAFTAWYRREVAIHGAPGRKVAE